LIVGNLILVAFLLIGTGGLFLFYVVTPYNFNLQQSNLKLVIRHLEVMQQLQEIIIDEIKKENAGESDAKQISDIVHRKMLDHMKQSSPNKVRKKLNNPEVRRKISDSELPSVVLQDIRARLRNRQNASSFKFANKSVSEMNSLNSKKSVSTSESSAKPANPPKDAPNPKGAV
jgi:hypothetical protein